MLLHLWLLAILCHVASSCSPFMTTGTLYPRDSDYLVGKNVTLRCTLKKTWILSHGRNYTFNSSFIYFKFGSNRLSSEVQLINELEAKTVIQNGQPKDNGMYYCYLKPEEGPDVLVCPTSINFGYPPEKVTNFKCRGYYWKNLTCYWTAPPNPSSVKYTLEYAASSSGIRLPCTEKLSKTSCGWSLEPKRKGDPIYNKISENLIMFLRGSNGIGNDSFQTFTIKHWAIVVAGQPINFTVTQKTSTDMSLEWEPPDGMKGFFGGICNRVKYWAESSPENILVEETDMNVTSLTLTGLIPNTLYVLELQARSCEAPADEEEDLWGPSVTILSRTESDIPWSPPEANGTFFEVVNTNWTRILTVYWKRIEKTYENGDQFHYVISLENASGNSVRRHASSVPEYDTTTQNYKKFYHLDLNSAYVVQIWSANAKGRSSNPTRIIIPEDSKMLQRPQQIRPVFLNSGTYNVSWKGSSEDVGEYALVWCQGEGRCELELKMMTVPSTTTSVVLLLVDNRNYAFGVAALFPDGTQASSLEWAPCTAYKNRVLDHLMGVRMDSVESRSLRVTWKPVCEAQKNIIDHYQVSLYKKDCHSKSYDVQEVKTVNDSEAESALFKNLTPFTPYAATVVAISKTGRSPESTQTCGTTLPDAPSEPPVLHPVSVSNTSITLSWHSSKYTNGIITHYMIYYREMSDQLSLFSDMSKNVGVPTGYSDQSVLNTSLPRLKCFANYSITISACVDTHCSNTSAPLYIKTSIGVPGPMDPPRPEIVNDTHVRVSWKEPEIPNGPIDRYLLHVFKKDESNVTRLDLLNLTETSVVLPNDCSPKVHTSGVGAHVFSVQALNLIPGKGYLYGPISNTTETNICLTGRDISNPLMIGIIVGSTLALAFVILSLYSVLRWMKLKVDKMKNIKVILPVGLQEPYSQSMNSYENFKNGISNSGSDPNLSPKQGYERSDSNDGDPDPNNADDNFKNRHGSGTSHFSTTSTDELIGKQNRVGQITAPKNVTIGGQKTMSKGDRNPSGDSSSGHDSISSSLTHRTNISTDGSSSSEGPHTQGKDPQSSRDSGLDEDSKPHSKYPTRGGTLPTSGHYLPTAPYSKLGLLESKCIGDYLPLARGRHLNFYSHNLANSEPSITDLNQQPYTLEQHAQCDPSSPDVPYSKFGISHSVTDLILEGMDLPESPLSSQPSPQEALPYSRFGLRRPPPPNQNSPYVTMGMALLMGPQKDPNHLLPSKLNSNPLVLKSPKKKDKNPVQPPDLLVASDDAYSKLGLSSVADDSCPPKFDPYLTLQEVKENEQNNRSLPDLTISSRESSPSHKIPDQVRHSLDEASSKSGYLPHQLIPSVNKAPEPVLPDFINCSNVLPISTDLQKDPEVKIQGSNGYVTLNQVLASNTNI